MIRSLLFFSRKYVFIVISSRHAREIEQKIESKSQVDHEINFIYSIFKKATFFRSLGQKMTCMIQMVWFKLSFNF